MGSDGSNRERDRGSIGGKEKPVTTTQSTAHDTVRHNKTKKDEKRAQFFFVCSGDYKKVACLLFSANGDHGI